MPQTTAAPAEVALSPSALSPRGIPTEEAIVNVNCRYSGAEDGEEEAKDPHHYLYPGTSLTYDIRKKIAILPDLFFKKLPYYMITHHVDFYIVLH